MSSNNNLLVKLNNAGYQHNDKWLVKGVSLSVEKGKIVTPVSYTHLTLPTKRIV